MATPGAPLPQEKPLGPLAPPPGYWAEAFRQGLAQQGEPEPMEGLARRLGIGQVRSFIIAQPGKLSVGKREVVFEILDGERRHLFDLVRDPKTSEELTIQFSQAVQVRLRATTGIAAFLLRASVLRTATATDDSVCRVGHLYLVNVASGSFMPSAYDCLFVDDAKGRSVFYNPSQLVPGYPERVSLAEAFLPNGDLLQRRKVNVPQHIMSFSDPSGQLLATCGWLSRNPYARLNELESVEMVGSAAPFAPLFHCLFDFVYGPMMLRYQAAHPFKRTS